MKLIVKSVALVAALSLLTAACAGDDEETTDDETTESTDETTEDAMDDSDKDEDSMDDEDASALPATVVEIATSSDDFSILVAALTKADLVGALSDPEGTFTVFAPTNDAFAAALVALDITQEELLAREDLADILKYHVLAIEVDADAAVAADGTDVDTLQGSKLAVSVVDGSVKVGDATVVAADNKSDNGIVHVIDSVLLPPSE